MRGKWFWHVVHHHCGVKRPSRYSGTKTCRDANSAMAMPGRRRRTTLGSGDERLYVTWALHSPIPRHAERGQ